MRWATLVPLAVLLVFAAVVDARERCLPNPLAALLACAGVGCALADGGIPALARNALAALAVAAFLTCFELVWRSRRGEAGQGMGDIKALAAVMLASPLLAVTGYALGMMALALAGLALRRRVFPFLPFFVGGIALAVSLAALAV